jgi:hypothetical protein
MSKPKTITMKDQNGNVVAEYRETVFLVNTYHDDGTPRLCTLIQDDQTISLAGGEHFMTALIPVGMYKGKS